MEGDNWMANLQILAFVKFFSEEAHADKFIKGQLYMKKLRYFQKLETTKDDDGRPDVSEGIVSWHQPDRVELELVMPGMDPIFVGKGDLAGPVSISRDSCLDMHVFCMTCLWVPNPAQLEGGHAEIQAQLLAALRVDKRCFRFGPHAVVVSASKFLPRLRRALGKRDHWFRADTVEYYNDKTFHGDFEVDQAVFRKQSKFSYQNEYRICLQATEYGENPIYFEIGDMSAFAIKVKSSELNELLRVTLRPLSDESRPF